MRSILIIIIKLKVSTRKIGGIKQMCSVVFIRLLVKEMQMSLSYFLPSLPVLRDQVILECPLSPSHLNLLDWE